MTRETISTGTVASVAARLYGSRPRVTPLRSLNNQAFLLEFGGRPADKVAKFARNEPAKFEAFRREQEILRVLGRRSFPVPGVEFTQDTADIRDLWSGAWHVMPRLPGMSLAEFTRSHPRDAAEALWRRAGAFPVKVSSVPVDEFPLRVRADRHGGFWQDAWTRFEHEKMLRDPFDRILLQARELMERTPVCFSHNDYGATQVVTDGETFHVIDWEGSGEGWELSALSRIVAMTREYGGREHGGNEQEQIAWLLAGYAEKRPLDDRARRDLHVWEMWQHVGVMSWKFACGEDHRRHAFEMAGRVETWWRQATA